MPDIQTAGQIVLAEDRSALALLHKVLTNAAAAFPDALAAVELAANAESFRTSYPAQLPQFEAARVAHPQRHEIARHMAAELQNSMVWQDGSGTRPLAEELAGSAAPLPLETHIFDGEPGWEPNLVYRGERWEATRLAELGELLVARNVMTPAAGDALARVCDEVLEDGVLRLGGRKIAMLGGGAEMAPTRLWLEAGADVLWLDTAPPPRNWWETSGMSGRLCWPKENTDLLTNPQQALATLIEFADGEPLDLGLYAYAPGKARELRLAASMNAIVNALPPALVGSVTILVSPTTPTALSAKDLAAMRGRLEARAGWEALCAKLGLLGNGAGPATAGNAAATRTVVSIQGASYQAAQYLAKVLTAEAWATYGQAGAAQALPLRVSANTAAITRTRSLAHPVFTAAFGGAAAFGVETMAPRQSRRINGLLAVCDWLQPAIPTPGAVRVHGGIHTLPYPLESALRIAAAIGFARSPRLLRGLFQR